MTVRSAGTGAPQRGGPMGSLQAAVEGGKLSGSEQVAVSIKLEMPSIGLEHTVEGSIALE